MFFSITFGLRNGFLKKVAVLFKMVSSEPFLAKNEASLEIEDWNWRDILLRKFDHCAAFAVMFLPPQ